MLKSRKVWFWGLALALAMVFVISACGGDDEVVPGVTDDEILLGTHTSLTGPIAVYSQISNTTKAYFDYINETKGGINGRKIKFILEDDAYSPPKTVDLIRKLVEQDKVFAIMSGLGTPTHLQVVDYLKERGVPDLFVASGAIEWVKDPAARPNIFGSLPHYVGEGTILGQYIAENFAGQKLGLMRQNDDFGGDGIDGIRRGVGDALEIVGEETHEAVDADLNAQVDRLNAAGADVIAIWATPRQFSTAIKHARLDLNWDVPFVLSTVSGNEFSIALSGPEVLEGTVSVTYIRQGWEVDHPGVAKHVEIIRQYAGMENASNLTLYGQYLGELMEQALILAGKDLTREGLIKAVESIKDFTCSMCLVSVTMSSSDHDPMQGAYLMRAEGGRWKTFGGLISYEGTLPDTMTVADLKK
jgi:ABC-type branched-subunit amino acid transport system substrate-binding protein